MNILFVCRANLQRSPTAEEMVREMTDEMNVKSAGIVHNAETIVDRGILEWADRIYVMTDSIKRRMESDFPALMKRKKVRVLGIRDRYLKGDEALKKKLLRKFSDDRTLSRIVENE